MVDPKKIKKTLDELERIFSQPVDEAEAEEFMRDWPVFDITEMKPGDVAAIHFPVKRPKPPTPE